MAKLCEDWQWTIRTISAAVAAVSALSPQRSGYLTPLSSLTEATARIGRARSVEDVVDTIRSTARSVIGCEGIAFIRREGDLCHYVEEDAIGPLWKGHKFPASACISGWAMINKQTAVVADVANDGRIPYELYEKTFVKALAMAPVRTDNPIAAIGAYWSHEYEPSRWEVEVLEALASAAATAIENISLLSSLTSADSHEVCSSEKPAEQDFQRDVERVCAIAAVPAILDIVLRMTGMGFAAVARVTEDRWIACQVLDNVEFGLKPGDELAIESTLCNEIRDHRQPIVFDDAAVDPQYRDHHTPRIYGLRSYISIPIILANGQFFGTLCAIDPNPAKVDSPQVVGTFKLFAELIGQHLDSGDRMAATEASLERERELAELREQFIAVLGHDLRNPIAAVEAGTSRLLRDGWTERSPMVLKLMKSSLSRMSGLVDSVMDLARARLGGGIVLSLSQGDINETLAQVVEELRVAHPHRVIVSDIQIGQSITADHLRMAQLFSNLVANAITHGAADEAVRIRGGIEAGQVEICVSNGGKPIPAEKLDKLFQPFRRGDAASSMQGLGLGLYIAYQIAQAHNGRIDVTSDATETCFILRMPVA